MSSILTGAQMPLPPLPDVDVKGGARARSNIPATLAGRARWLHEYVTGTTSTGNNPCAPYTGASGGPGHDHGGGVMGRPIQHTFCVLPLGYGPDGITGITYGEAPQQTVATGTGTPVDPDYSNIDVFDDVVRVFVPPSGTAPSMSTGKGGAYDSVVASVVVKSTASVTVRVIMSANGTNISWDENTSGTTAKHVISSTGDEKLKMRPGRVNNVRVRIQLRRIAADCHASVHAIAFHQVLDDATP